MKNGYNITIVQFTLGNWSDEKSKILLNELQYPLDRQSVSIIELDATRKKGLVWFYFTIVEKFSRVLYRFFRKSLKLTSYGHSRRSAQIVGVLRKVDCDIDFICAHNLGALYPACFFGEKRDVPFIFDIEDYHPGEWIKSDTKFETLRREQLMIEMLPKAYAVTFASPLIWEETKALIGEKNNRLILNTFSKNDFRYCGTTVRKTELDFVWFSQNISHGRGLEEFLDAVPVWLEKNDSAKISLTLIGNMYHDFSDYVKNVVASSPVLINRLKLDHIPPMSQEKLHKQLNNYDVGLAIEVVNDLNRDLCLTNKLFAYLQSGLFVLASNTRAQKDFLFSYEECGFCTELGKLNLVQAIQQLWNNREKIRDAKLERIKHSQELSWENESLKIIDLWKQIVQ